MKAILRRLRDRFFAGVARQRDLDRLYDQIGGLVQIQNAMTGNPVLRPLRGSAISPDAMVWILADLQERRSPTIIEFGSGQSTVILAAALRQCGGRLTSVDHDPAYLGATQRQVAACGLSEYVHFIFAALKDTSDNPPIRSYDLDHLPARLFDMVLIDGPPFWNNALTRLPPLRWAVQHLNPDGIIFLDDAAREGEQMCLRCIQTEYPGLKSIYRNSEKGLIELHGSELFKKSASS